MTVCVTYLLPTVLLALAVPVIISVVINKLLWNKEGKSKFIFYAVLTAVLAFFLFLLVADFFSSCKIGYIAGLF